MKVHPTTYESPNPHTINGHHVFGQRWDGGVRMHQSHTEMRVRHVGVGTDHGEAVQIEITLTEFKGANKRMFTIHGTLMLMPDQAEKLVSILQGGK